MVTADRSDLARRFRIQARSCENLGSPLYAHLLTNAAADIETGGPVWKVMREHASRPRGSARALRLMGAVHRRVLEGKAPELAPFYPTVGGDATGAGAWDAFLGFVERTTDDLRSLAGRPVQTNEVGRSGALVGGFLEVARTTGLPLRVLELGSSAGLNLRWDHFLYEARGVTWGDKSSPVRLCDFNSERPPPFDVTARVQERRGCDPHPVDPLSDEGARTLIAYVWPDQTRRIRLLRAAIEVARRVPSTVDEEDAAQWLGRQLAEPAGGVATVVFHSIVLQYMSEETRAGVDEVMSRWAERATREAPLARLEMEPGGDHANVHLTMWPGAEKRLVATAGYHGAHVRWLL